MKNIFLLTDYKNNFGSKHFDSPYRSGFDKLLLKKYFNEAGYEPVFSNFAAIDFNKENFKDELVLYTSSEDDGYYYKSFIEDVVLGLELQGAKVIPEYKYLRANNNKVFMEILRKQIINDNSLNARYYGTLEELKKDISKLQFPVVIKTAEGASGSGVYLAHSQDEIISITKKIARTKNINYELWDYGRGIKHKGYVRDSKYRKKFIVQEFVPNLKNDWKILIYWDKYFILYRGVRDNDFRASGSGKFIFDNDHLIPSGLFDFAENIFNSFNVPNASFDICYDGRKFYLTEFQLIYFGTTTIEKADSYYTKREPNKWEKVIDKIDLEKIYVESIIKFLDKNKLGRIFK